MSLPTSCCSVPPVKSSYEGKGVTIKSPQGFDLYLTGPQGAKSAILMVYDIFGYHPNTYQFCDILGEQGFRVALPDFFRGKPWDKNRISPEDRPAIIEWVGKVGSWDIISPDVTATLDHLRAEGSEKFGIAGFCWGGYTSAHAAQGSTFSAAGLIHPAMITPEIVALAQCPLMILASKDEPDMAAMLDTLSDKPFASRNYHQRFDDMSHGWAASRGDWSDPIQAQRAREAVQLTASFMKKNVGI